jgi:uncharacterized membrane protein
MSRKAQNPSDPQDSLTVQAQQIFSGPIPPPAVLRQYGEIGPDLPERIMKMAEAHAAADVKRKLKESSAIGNGQIFSFALGLVGFGVCTLLALRGIEAGAITAAIGGIIPIVVAALSNLKSRRKE